MYGGTVNANDLLQRPQVREARTGDLPAPRRFFVVGPAGSGKSEFARMLAEELRAQRPAVGPVILGECGEILIKLLAEQLSVGPHKLLNDHNKTEDWIANIKQWKPKYRAQLRWLGDLLSMVAPGFLARAALASVSAQLPEADRMTRICVGVRRAIECRAVLAQGDVWILVQRAGIEPVSDSFELKFFYPFCKVKVENDGDLAALRAKAKAFVETL